MFIAGLLAAFNRSADRHTGNVLRVAIWSTRTIGLSAVGVLTFVTRPSAAGAAGTQTVCFILMCVGVVVWALGELWPVPPQWLDRRLLPAALLVVTVTGCLGAAAGGTGDAMIGMSAAAVMSASVLGLPGAVAVAGCGVLAVEVGAIAFGQGFGTLLGFPLLLAVGLLVGRNRESYRIQAEQNAALLAQHVALRAEQRRADVLDERARIAREIHDVLAHSLGALGIQIQAARAVLTDHADIDRALGTLATAQRMASDGLAETRRAVLALRTDTLPLPEELARAAAEHTESHRVIVHCETTGATRPIPPDATVALLRTAREALVNAAKHAPGRRVELLLAYRPDGLRLTVANALGRGPEASQSPVLRTVDAGYGLTGMRERLRLLRGTLDAGVRGERWVVEADLPLDPAATTAAAAPSSTSRPTVPSAPDPQKADR